MAGLFCASECPSWDGGATGRGAEAPHTAASGPVADTGAASFSLSFATNSAGVKYAGVPKKASPDAALLHALVEAREEGRRFVVCRPEKALTNWFAVKPPQQITYYRFDGVQEQVKLWLDTCP
jgi:hypothetical protein